ncbi:MAG: hypothetical protein R3325_05785 [Thermoanaerobaculia bacterium]|nr:hypothetical protein [Thermoanaerobaculia bacterium]
MTRHLDTIVELQEALDERRLAEERLSGIPDWMRELHDEHSEKSEEIEALEQEAETALLEHRAAAGEVSDLQQKRAHYQEQISQVRNQREYGALLHEIDAAKETARRYEEQGLAALERHEEARERAASLRDDFAELDQRYSTELDKWEAEKPSVTEQIEKLDGRIEALKERLPKPILIAFERIFERYQGSALTEVMATEQMGKKPKIYHCATCNYRVRPQAVVEIVNQGRIVTCDSCKKILYLPGETS